MTPRTEVSEGLAGARSRPVGETRRLARLAGVALIAAALLAGLTGCGGGAERSRLLDGSRASELPRALQGLHGDPIMTGASLVAARKLEPELASCDLDLGLPVQRRVVRRIGVRTESLTLRIGNELRACDRDRQALEGVGKRWCGISAGRLHGGRLRDPRLDLCEDGKGRPVAAFLWIEPAPKARWIVVDQPGHVEVYPVAGDVPVRVSTAADVDLDSSSAMLTYSQYSGDGRLIGRSTLRAFVAG